MNEQSKYVNFSKWFICLICDLEDMSKYVTLRYLGCLRILSVNFHSKRQIYLQNELSIIWSFVCKNNIIIDNLFNDMKI